MNIKKVIGRRIGKGDLNLKSKSPSLQEKISCPEGFVERMNRNFGFVNKKKKKSLATEHVRALIEVKLRK